MPLMLPASLLPQPAKPRVTPKVSAVRVAFSAWCFICGLFSVRKVRVCRSLTGGGDAQACSRGVSARRGCKTAAELARTAHVRSTHSSANDRAGTGRDTTVAIVLGRHFSRGRCRTWGGANHHDSVSSVKARRQTVNAMV